jgi:hypothetical protein
MDQAHKRSNSAHAAEWGGRPGTLLLDNGMCAAGPTRHGWAVGETGCGHHRARKTVRRASPGRRNDRRRQSSPTPSSGAHWRVRVLHRSAIKVVVAPVHCGGHRELFNSSPESSFRRGPLTLRGRASVLRPCRWDTSSRYHHSPLYV